MKAIFNFQFSQLRQHFDGQAIFNHPKPIVKRQASKVRGQAGVVSLLTTMILSLLLTVIVTSAVTLSVGELRQSENGDQAVKAYFAAEAGVEDALLQVKKDLHTGIGIVHDASNCNAATPSTLSSDNPGVAYTCQTIKTGINQLTGQLDVDQATQIGPIGGFTNATLYWHQYGSDPDVVGAAYSGPGSTYSTRGAWNFPAALELTALSYDSTQLITPGCPKPTIAGCAGSHGISILSTLIGPNTGGTGNINNKTNNGKCSQANVTTTDGYNCTINLSGFSAGGVMYMFRLRPRYTGGHYSIQFSNGTTPVTVSNKVAVIDVTAQAGKVFRRVEAQVPLTNGAASGLDYVLFSDTDICKDFNVSANVASQNTAPSAALCPSP